MSANNRIEDAAAAVRYILAGRAVVTLVSGKTGRRFTYRVRLSQDRKVYFVAVLDGPDNVADYAYLGTIRGTQYCHGTKSRVGRDAPSAQAFAWAWGQLMAGRVEGFEVWHEGRCGRCGRELTVPESIAMGLGPECATKAW